MKRIITILPVLISFASIGQDSLSTKKLFINLSGHYGFIIPHHKNMEYLIKRHVFAGELDYVFQTNGEKRWEKIYNHPEKGLGFYCADLGNPDQLGEALGLFPFINLQLNSSKKFKLCFRVGDGLGIVTKPYNRIKNHKNNINGSMLNTFISLRLNSVFYPWKNIRMETGIGLTHLSNGAYATPNLGINIPTINIGLSVFQKNLAPAGKTAPADTANKNNSRKYFIMAVVAAGPNQNSPPGGKTYGAYTFYTGVWRSAGEKSRFCLGTDAFYEFSNIYYAINDTLYDTSKKINTLQLGTRLGYELVIGKVSLPVEMGYYWFSKITTIGHFYHRIGIRYQVSKHIMINYSLRTHWVTAENLEIGLGYKF